MKKKLSIFAFGLLLAVGWTNVVQAQRSSDSPSTDRTLKAMSPANVDMNRTVMAGGEIDMKDIVGNAGWLMAPRRANYNETADATHVYDWYDAKTYTWSDGSGTYTAKYTDPASNPYQIAYLLGSTYMNPEMPGIKYSGSWGIDHPYYNIEFGWDIPSNARWNLPTVNKPNYGNIVIHTGSSNGYNVDYARIVSMRILSGNNVISSWDYATNGTTLPQGWNLAGSWSIDNNGRLYTSSASNTLSFPGEILVGLSDVKVEIVAYDYSYSSTGYRRIYVNNSYQNITSSSNLTLTWNINSSGSSASVTPPYENGYTVFLVKVKDYDIANRAPQSTSSWDGNNSIINYFNNYIDEVVLLTDGMRVEEGEVDAGTVFTYSGILNRFYFIGKGKNSFISSSSSSSAYDLAPTYGMYEEFSPTSTASGAEITDFYSRMLEGESYGIVHDCQGVNYLQHFFSMSGNTGTDAKSLTNLIFYIPDNRAILGDRNYEPEHAPQVGLYNITLTAKAVPVPDYSPSNRYYNVTNDWVSSLHQILDFDVDQDYELWIWIYDTNGNPVAKEKVEGTDIFHNTLTYTYQVPQLPESYTIVYRVKGWPKDATNNPVNDPDGTFYTWSNLAEVLIPGYENFLSLKLDHYESDFKIDEEHNYYRNFMTVGNQNPDNALTANRILAGEDLFKLYRFADGDKNNKVKAAELSFFQQGNDIWYNIDYFGQNILNGYDLQTLNIPTRGPLATIGGGKFVKVTSTNDITNGQYLIVYETDGVAFDGSLVGSDLDKGHNEIPVNIENGEIEANHNIMASTFTIDRAAGTVKSASGYYIGRNASSNGMNTSATNAYSNTISISNNNAIIQGAGGYQLRFNSSSGNDNYRFRYYASTSQKAIQLYKLVENRDGQTRSFSMLNNDLDVVNYSTGYVYPTDPWSVTGTNLSLQSNGCFYILAGNGLDFTMPAGFNDANLKFVVHVGNSSYYNGTFNFTTPSGNYSVPTTAANADYEVIIPNVNSGDVINIKGTCIYNNQNYSYSPDFSTLYVYVEGGQGGVGGDDPLYLASIMFVDQFNAPTKNDTHPYRYGYFLQYDPEEGDPETSSVQEVPVQHTGATLGGYYTTDQIQGDTDMGLTMDVMNAQVNMNLANNPAIYFYTLDRKPSNDADAEWDEISQLQIRTDGTYQEIDEKLTQYIEQVCEPGIVPRYDNETYSVLYGNYNDYMNYVPVVWTHGELVSNRRIKWESEHLHNSYGAPIWKTGVGKVEIYQGTYAERQTGKFGSTNWTDENGDSCSLYMLVLDAKGFLPTANTIGNTNGYVPYVPYWFNVYAKSETGKLRGFSWVGEGSPGAGHPGEPGSHVVNDQTHNRYLWHLYGGPTTDGILQHGKSDTWAENWIFGALDEVDDLEIVVRYYYVVNGMAGRDGGPAGYGSESPGFAPPTPTAVIENWTNRTIVSTIYVNPQGMQSDKPFDGVNIVINRYEDGSTSTSKVIK